MRSQTGRTVQLAVLLLVPILAPGFAARSQAPAPVLRREERAISIVLNAPPDTTFPLFGPVGETRWDPGWKPRFLYPLDGSQSGTGAVFLTSGSAGRESTWLMPTYDVAKREVEYVIVTPGYVAIELRILVAPDSIGRSRADIRYRYTALSETANGFIDHWAAHFPSEGPHWAAAINAYLAARGASAGPRNP